jgi:SAM-dependent methyltransferase
VKSWFTIDGALDPIEYRGESFFRFPEELVEIVIANATEPGDRILDPFCGFGTTLVVAERLGRVGVGIEKDEERAVFASSRLRDPSWVVRADALQIGDLELEPFDLIFTSPPYATFREGDDEGVSPHYFADLRSIFSALQSRLKPTGALIVEVSNVRDGPSVRTLAWDVARELGRLFSFEGETVRCNTSSEPAGPGFDHSYLLAYRRP